MKTKNFSSRLNEFQPKRLIQARLSKKWNQHELAERVEITRQAISAYEKEDGSKPTPENLRKLSKWLEVPESYFFAPLRASEVLLESAINFRTLKANKSKARFQATSYMEWTVSLYDFVSEKIELPKVDLPNLKFDDFLSLNGNDIEQIATDVRRYFGLSDGPISNITRLLENKGVITARVPLESGMDGVSAWYNKRPVILVNSSAYHARSRFDAGHELFHILAHRDVTIEDLEDKKTLDFIEKQAHRFAGAFLTPEQTFVSEVYNLDFETLLSLKERWGISVQAIIVRLCDLGLISDYQKTRLFTKISSKGWRRKEPLDGEISPEEPIFIEKVANFLDNEKILPLKEFVFRSGLPKRHVGLFVEAPEINETTDRMANVLEFKPRS